MLKPNIVGEHLIYDPNVQGSTGFTSADLAAIDADLDQNQQYPYAYSGTVRDDYDACKYYVDDAGVHILADKKNSFGVFLSADEDIGDFLFVCSGRVEIFSEADLMVYPFLGVRTGSAVTSSLVAASNSVSDYMLLPCDVSRDTNCLSVSWREVCCYIHEGNGYPLCHAFTVENPGSDNEIIMRSSIMIHKWKKEINVYNPSRR